jgi:hypothetical protein
MNIAVKLAATFVVGIALGIGVTWFTVERNVAESVKDGPWETNLQIGSPSSDLYTRASVALNGLFAFNRAETIYYLATKDSAGDALNGSCQYEIDGRDPDARWWSLTAYGRDKYLIANPAHRYAFDKTNVWRVADGHFSISVGSRPQQTNWIPVTGSSFSLVLRLFDPDPRIARAPEHARLPDIKRTECL